MQQWNRETFLIHMENEEWTREENNFFENLLAILNLDEPKSWEKIVAQVPGKTVEQVQKHYEALVEDLKLIESGSFPLPHYREEKEGIRKEVMGYGEETEGMKKETKVMKKDIREGTEGMRKDDGEGTQVNDHQQRKKGTPWTEDEHRFVDFFNKVMIDEIFFFLYIYNLFLAAFYAQYASL